MHYFKYFLTLLYFLFLLPVSTKAQYLDSLPDIFFKGKIKDRSLHLRAIPLNANAWRKLNAYTIHKVTVSENVLWPINLQAKESWTRDTLNNELVLASFNLNFLSDEALLQELPKSNDSTVIEYTHDELENFRYIFNFLGCNQNFNLALKNGLAYIDNTFDVRKDVQYIFKHSFLDSQTILYTDRKLETLVKPPAPTYSISENQFLFEWPSSPYMYHYFTFNLEKSYDGKKYMVLNEEPIINFYTEVNKSGFRSYFSFQDTLSHGVTLYYRLRGIDYFGDIGDPGDPVIINMPKRIMPPLINFYDIKNNQLELQWEFNKNEEKEIQYFNIWVSDSSNGLERKMIKEKISKSNRSISLINTFDRTKFYILEAVRLNTVSSFSGSKMVVVYDNIPPSKPKSPFGNMDGSGLIKITWLANEDPDLIGYRVFRSVDSMAEFTQITYAPIDSIHFTDTISLHTLSKEIYYKIAAVDQNGNQSLFSAIGTIAVFDTICPSAPSFYFYKPGHNRIHLKWYNSSSPDIVQNTLLRRLKNPGADWEVIMHSNRNILSDSIIDTSLDPNLYYEYMLIAKDKAGNISKGNYILLTKPLFSPFLPPIENITAYYDEEKKNTIINWKYEGSNIYEYWLYKSKNEEPLTLFKQLASIHNLFSDEDVSAGNSYVYKIKAIHLSGRESKISKPVIITISR